jgi:mannose-6-phosphate isomerase-like protein (cupin superfamily)
VTLKGQGKCNFDNWVKSEMIQESRQVEVAEDISFRIPGVNKSVENAGNYPLLVQELQKVSSDMEQSQKIGKIWGAFPVRRRRKYLEKTSIPFDVTSCGY